jgi:hypothetical protein
VIRIKQVPPYPGAPVGQVGRAGKGEKGDRGKKSHLCVGGAPNWRARAGIQRVRARGLDGIAGIGRRHGGARRPPLPACLLLTLAAGCLSVWTKGREKIAVAEDKRGKRNWSSRPKRVRVAPTRPDPTHEAALGRPLGWDGHPTGAEDDGRRGPKDTGQPRRPRITGDGGGGRSVVVAAERSGTERNGGRWGSGAKAWCDVWPVATDTLD